MNTTPLRQHWFFVVAPLIIGLDVLLALEARGEIDRLMEAGLLFDLVIAVPCAYWFCYRHRGRSALTRAAALACLGVWGALKLVPEDERELLVIVEPLRYLGLGALAVLEVVVMVGIYRKLFGGKSVEQVAAAAPQDMPAWVIRLMALEAAFWRRVWHAIRRLARRDRSGRE